MKLLSSGRSLAEVHAETGLPKSTLTRWARKAGVGTFHTEQTAHATEALAAQRALKREQMVDLLIDQANDLIHRMNEQHGVWMQVGGQSGGLEQVFYERATSADVRNYAVAAAVLIDKMRLELGEATERKETINIDDARAELASKVDELAKRRAQKSA